MNREVICSDAIDWLESQSVIADSSLIASLPDISEFPHLNLEQWKKWFINTATLILSRCPDNGVSVFFQSDIKVEGVWVDKAFLCQQAALAAGHELLWHKIICRAPVGITTFGRPSYSHLLCFSKKLRVDVASSTADVLGEMGEKAWERGMGLNACLMVSKFLAEQTATKVLINPFCGLGSMLATANLYQLAAIGIEKSPKRAEKARRLQVAQDRKSWILE